MYVYILPNRLPIHTRFIGSYGCTEIQKLLLFVSLRSWFSTHAFPTVSFLPHTSCHIYVMPLCSELSRWDFAPHSYLDYASLNDVRIDSTKWGCSHSVLYRITGDSLSTSFISPWRRFKEFRSLQMHYSYNYVTIAYFYYSSVLLVEHLFHRHYNSVRVNVLHMHVRMHVRVFMSAYSRKLTRATA